MQKARSNDRQWTRDYHRKNRDRAGGHKPTRVRWDGWPAYMQQDGRKTCKRYEARAKRRETKIIIRIEIMDYFEENIRNGVFCYPEDKIEEDYYYDD